MKRVLLIVVLVVLGLTAVDCSKKNDKSSDKPVVFEQSSSGFTAQLTLSEDPVPVMKAMPLVLALSDVNGQPVSATSVSYDLTMPGMTMPPNQPNAIEKKDGVYQAQAIFTMAGDWRCGVQAELPDGTLLEFTFDFKAK